MHGLRPPAQTRRQVFERPLRRRHVVEAEGFETQSGLLHTEPSARGPDESVQDRSEVETLVNVANDRPHLADPLFELAGRIDPHSQGAAQLFSALRVIWDLVGLSQVPELDPVFEISPEPVGGVEPGTILLTHESEVGQGLEGFECARLPQLRGESTMDQLEELDRELDVPDTTSRPLDVGRPRSRLRLLLQLAEAPQGVHVETLLPDHGLDHGGEAFAEGGVAGDGTRLQQRLELPRLAPPGVVLRIRVEASREGPDRSLRPQIGVDEEPWTVGSPGGQGTDDGQGEGEGGGPARRFVITCPVVDEEQVDVGRVVQLSGAPFPHCDDGEGEVGDQWVFRRDRCRSPRLDILHQVVDGIREPGGRNRHVDDTGQVVPGDGGQRGPPAQRDRILGGRPDEQIGSTGDRLTQSARSAGNCAGSLQCGAGEDELGVCLDHRDQSRPGSGRIGSPRHQVDDGRSPVRVRYQDLESCCFCWRNCGYGPSVGHVRQRMPGRIVGVCHSESPGLN